METIVTSPVAQAIINLDDARNNLVRGVVKSGELIKDYAKALCQTFNLVDNSGKVTTPWYDLKGKLAQGVKAERAKFAEALKGAGLEKAIDVYWQRVKEASGRAKNQNRVQGSSDPEALCLSDLGTIINRIFKMEENGSDSDWSDEKAVLMDVYSRMGGDVDKLG